MISHMTYVRCNTCGNPGPLTDSAKEARAEARAEGWKCVKGSGDLCPNHRPDRPTHCGVPMHWYDSLTGYLCLDCGAETIISRNKA